MEEAIDWLRENDPYLENIDDDASHEAMVLADLAGISVDDDITAEAFVDLAGISYEGRPRSRGETKRKAMEDALNWVRNNDPETEDDADEDLVRR